MALTQRCSFLESYDGCGNCASSFPHCSGMAAAALCVSCVSGVTERCLISPDGGFYAQWRSFMAPVGCDLYACPIMRLFMEGMLDPKSFFCWFFFPHCCCLNELWQIGQTKARRGTQIINFLWLLFVGVRLKKKETKNDTTTRGSQTCIYVFCCCCPCCQSNFAVLFYKYVVSPPAKANDVNDVSNPRTADDHVRQWQS